MKNFYQILGVSINATNDEIKIAYRKLATKFHPDKNDGDKYFEERFKEIQIAYEVLSNENSRSEYNKKLYDFYQEKFEQSSYKSNSENVNKSEENQKSNKKTNNTVAEEKTPLKTRILHFFKQKSTIITLILIALPIIGFLVNSGTGLITVLAVYLCIFLLLGSLGDRNENGCFPLILIAFLIYLIVQIFSFFFGSNEKENNVDRANSVDSAAVAVVDSGAIVADSAIAVSDFSNANVLERPSTYTTLNNGDSPLNSCFGEGKFKGSAYITFKNSNETDAIVCLVDYSTNKTIRNEYIKAGTDYTMRKIPTGTYFLKAYYGNDWNNTKQNFCGSSGGFNFDESFSKSDGVGDLISIENSRSGYTTGTITLYKVENGNMSSEQINEQEFFK